MHVDTKQSLPNCAGDVGRMATGRALSQTKAIHSSTIKWSACCGSRFLRVRRDACRSALEMRPKDYSLWNKLGATQANSSRSQEAIAAYQRALDLKPNYMRAWTNMGIAQVRTPLQPGPLSGDGALAARTPLVCDSRVPEACAPGERRAMHSCRWSPLDVIASTGILLAALNQSGFHSNPHQDGCHRTHHQSPGLSPLVRSLCSATWRDCHAAQFEEASRQARCHHAGECGQLRDLRALLHQGAEHESQGVLDLGLPAHLAGLLRAHGPHGACA